jgi:hypothetical protein
MSPLNHDPSQQPNVSEKRPTGSSRRSPGIRFLGLALVTLAVAALGFFWLQNTALFGEGGSGGKDTVSALLEVAKYEPSLLRQSGRESRETERDWENFQRTQLAILKSRLILTAAIQKAGNLDLIRKQRDPVTWLAENLQAGFVDKSKVLRIAMTGDRPADRAKLVNAVVDAYVEQANTQIRFKQEQRLEKLRDLLARYQRKLLDRREKLLALVKVGGGEESAKFWREQTSADLRAFLRQLRRVKLSQIDAQAQLNVYRTQKQPDKEILSAMGKLEKELAVLKEKQTLLSRALKERKAHAEQMDNGALQVDELRESITVLERTGREIASQIMQCEADKEAPDRIRVLERATAP